MSQEAEFGELLDRLIHERFGSQAKFAAALESARAGIGESTLSRILRGLYPPPIDKISTWTRLLGLRGRDAIDFRIAAELTLLPKDSALVKDIEETEQALAQLRIELDELTAENRTLRSLITTRAATDPPATP